MDYQAFNKFDDKTVIAIVKQNRVADAVVAINSAFGFKSEIARAAQALRREQNIQSDRVCNEFHDQKLMMTYRDEIYEYFKLNIHRLASIDKAAKTNPQEFEK